MRGTILHAPGDVRFEERPDPVIKEPSDAIVRTVAACVCGSDLWPYRGLNEFSEPWAIGHEYCGIVEEVGDSVTSVRPGQFVIGGFMASDNTCPNCRAGFQTSCQNVTGYDGCQSEYIRIPMADGTLVATPDQPADDLIPSLLTLSDVMATGWFAAVSSGVQPGMTVAVVGDGAVGLCGVLAAAEMGAERVIAMSRYETRQQLAKEFGATEIVVERGDEGIARIKDLTDGIGADAVLECVGTNDSMLQALRSTRPGGIVGYVGSPTESSCRSRRCSSPTSVCAVVPPPYASSCRTYSTGSGVVASIRARCSTPNCRSSRWPTPTEQWISVRRSRCCCAHERPDPSPDGGSEAGR